MRVLSILAAVCALPCALAQSWTVSNYQQTILMDIAMVSDSVGFMAGAINGQGACAFKTTDGGNNWDALNTNPTGATMFYVSTAAQSEENAILGGVSLLSGSAQYLVNGEAFTNASEPGVYMEQAMSAYSLPLSDAYALVGQINVAHINASADVAISYDGGKTYAYLDIGTQQEAHGGAFPTSQTWFVAAGTWPSNNSSQPNSTLSRHISRDVTYSVHGKKSHLKHTPHRHAKDSTGYVGQIAKTSDAGDSWSIVYTTDQFYFPAIACPSENVCYAVGCGATSSTILKSTDSGNTWNEILEVDDSCLTAAAAISENEVWIAGGAADSLTGLAYLTQDGGNTFSNVTIPGQMFTSLYFTDATHGWATCMNEMQQSGVLIYA